MKRLVLEETTSTQDEAFKLREIHDSVLVMARRQSGGRGRRGHRWHSPEGGLYVSLGWRDMEPSRALMLNLIAPVSIVELLDGFAIEGAIKLPNDVLVQGKKIAGVLVEVKGGKTVLGIGLNVNQESFPQQIEATSMRLITGREYPLEDILSLLESRIRENMGLSAERVLESFNRYMLRGSVRFRYAGKEVRDTILKIDGNLKAIGEAGEYLLHWMEDVRYEARGL